MASLPVLQRWRYWQCRKLHLVKPHAVTGKEGCFMTSSRLFLVPEKGILCPFTEPVLKLDPSFNGLIEHINEGDTFLMAMNQKYGLYSFESIPQKNFKGMIVQECVLMRKTFPENFDPRQHAPTLFIAVKGFVIVDWVSTSASITDTNHFNSYYFTSDYRRIVYSDAADDRLCAMLYNQLLMMVEYYRKCFIHPPYFLMAAEHSRSILRLGFALLLVMQRQDQELLQMGVQHMFPEITGKDIAERFAAFSSYNDLVQEICDRVYPRIEQFSIDVSGSGDPAGRFADPETMSSEMASIRDELMEIRRYLREGPGGNGNAEGPGVAPGEAEADLDDDKAEIERKLNDPRMPKEVIKKYQKESKRLRLATGDRVETAMVRNYLNNLMSLPWIEQTEVKDDLEYARTVLDEDHYGLEKVKERILEYLAVQKRSDRLHAPIICLVGPPGVGKTSLGKSLARATGRKYTRLALGGIHDEADIRGFNRTYAGSDMGKIMRAMTKIGVNNPLFLLDEIDKVSGISHHGDPSAALLEVLDPEQNNSFMDTYLEVGFDLSNVMFVATANTLDIPSPLLDRMEIIQLDGYTMEEKFQLAKKFLIPRQFQYNGVSADEVVITDNALRELITNYTREAGVRSLDRLLSRLLQKAVKEIRLSKKELTRIRIDSRKLQSYLGPGEPPMKNEHRDIVGTVNGLAYTTSGGDVLSIEAEAMPGKGREVFTGKLGDVMKESIAAAITVVRVLAPRLNVPDDFFGKHDLHIHFPAGAVPKDGPSAGISIAIAIVSIVTGIPVRGDVAMTGEISLHGRVLPVGGLRAKLSAARREGIFDILIPEDNVKDLEEVPAAIKKDLNIMPVKNIEEVLAKAFRCDVFAAKDGKGEPKTAAASDTGGKAGKNGKTGGKDAEKPRKQFG